MYESIQNKKGARRGKETPEHKRGRSNDRMLASLEGSEESKGLAGIDDIQQNQSNASFKDEAIQLLSLRVDKKSEREVFELN